MMSSLAFFIHTVSILVAVSFYTLFERKLLSASHIRQGPSMVGPMGLLQPFADAIKLFNKDIVWLKYSNYGVYLMAPVLAIMWCTLLVSVASSELGVFIWSMFPLALLLVITIGLFPILLSGWSSNSAWAVLGSIRCVAQAVSYEVSLAFFMVFWLCGSLSSTIVDVMQILTPMMCLSVPLMIAWCCVLLAEANRTPFDFAEAESELVSGFNVEYAGGWFACVFISEYTSMIMFSILTALLATGSSALSGCTLLMVSLLLYYYVWARCSYPRTRYDKLMSFSWFSLLPVALMLLWASLVS